MELKPTEEVVLHRSVEPREDLPVPRLEMLFLPTDQFKADGHNAVWCYRMIYLHYSDMKLRVVPLGTTFTRAGRLQPTPPDRGMQKFCTPFRDGVHIRFDMQNLRLPAYVLFNDEHDVIPYQYFNPKQDSLMAEST